MLNRLMEHNWVGNAKERRCSKCGAVQTKSPTTDGRIKLYLPNPKWLPSVKRKCPVEG